MALIHDFDAILTAIRAQSTGAKSSFHGERHWRCVGWIGAHLAAETPGSDPVMALLFSLFHDSMRRNDGLDFGHGKRGGAFARTLNGTGFELSPVEMETLEMICARHTSGGTTPDPTIGVCWDSDRLNLWRVGMTPQARYLSTDSAKARIAWSRPLFEDPPTWDSVYERFAALW